MFTYPKLLGKFENTNIYLNKGEYGFYLTHNKNKYSLSDGNSELKLDDAIKIIESKKLNIIKKVTINEGSKKIIATILNGNYGPYVQIIRGKNKLNYSIPKNIDPNNISDDEIQKLISAPKSYNKNKFKNKMSGSKTNKKFDKKHK